MSKKQLKLEKKFDMQLDIHVSCNLTGSAFTQHLQESYKECEKFNVKSC